MDHEFWKILHLLFRTGSATGTELNSTESRDYSCIDDALHVMEHSGIVSKEGESYRLTPPIQSLLSHCTVAKNRSGAFAVDTREVFVIMPFKRTWDKLYEDLIKPAVKAAKLKCRRADKEVQAGVLNDKLVGQIFGAGLCIAEVTSPNPNVFYEVGFAHAIGKETIFLLDKRQIKKQRKSDVPLLPSDIKGSLYIEYDRRDLEKAKSKLTDNLKKWIDRHHPKEVSKLIKSASKGS